METKLDFEANELLKRLLARIDEIETLRKKNTEKILVECPICHEAIDKLVVNVDSTTEYFAFIDEDDRFCHKTIKIDDKKDGEMHYLCPKCKRRLYSNAHDADAFLRGKKIPLKMLKKNGDANAYRINSFPKGRL
jgi:uncharacterized C2H2 Zn-finger protein